MIEIKKYEKDVVGLNHECSCCKSKELVVELHYGKNVNYLNGLRLCKKCLEELYIKSEEYMDKCEFCGQIIYTTDEVIKDINLYHEKCYEDANWEIK